MNKSKKNNNNEPVKTSNELIELTNSLKKSEERFRLIVEQSPIAIDIYNPDGSLFLLNRSWSKIFGLNQQQVKESYAKYNILKDKQIINSGYMPEIKRGFKGQKLNPFTIYIDSSEMMKQFKFKNTKGRSLWIRQTGFPIKDESGNVIYIVFFGEDITDKKGANIAIKESEEKFSKAFSTSPYPIILSDLETGEIYDVNSSFTELTGHKKDEAVGNTTIGLKLWKGDVSRDELREQMEKGRSIKDLEIKFLKKSGEEFISLLTINRLDVGDTNMILSTIIDITDKRKAEEALKLKDDAIESSINAIGIADMNGTMIYVNKACINMWGYSKKEEIIGRPLTDFWWQDGINKTLHELKTQGFSSGEDMGVKKDGSLFPLQYSTNVITDNEGNSQHIFGSFIDITERKKAEDTLEENEKKYISIFDYANDAIFLIKNSVIVEVNKRAEEMFGRPKEELINITPWDQRISVKSFDGKLAKEAGMEYLSDYEERKNGKFEWLHYKKNGEPFYVEVSLRRIILKGEQYEHAIIRDISDRKESELEIERSEEKFNKLFHTSPNVITISNIDDGTMIDINDAGVKALGYRKKEIIGKTSLELQLITKENRDFLVKLIKRDGRYSRLEFPVRLRSGETRIGLFYGQIIEISGKNFLFQTIVDITERKQYETELNKAYEEIKGLKDRLQAENIYLRKSIESSDLHKDIVGNSEQIKDAVAKALQVAPTDTNVLVLGETGTGKELIANGIYQASNRNDKTLVTVNCAAIPETLIESELFGHEKGAFTDASTKKIGLFEIANDSTIFLDEIGELPYSTQAKLLRVIDNKEIRRLGSNQAIKVNVRIIAATNQDLKVFVKEKKFRQDLFYRLNVFPIELPPLRIRKVDIKPLVEKFVNEFNLQMGKQITNISTKALKTLEKYSWPGNVRELKNVIERSMISSTGRSLQPIVNHISENDNTDDLAIEDVERNHIKKVLALTHWKISGKGGAAEILGLNRNTLNSRIKKLGIARP